MKKIAFLILLLLAGCQRNNAYQRYIDKASQMEITQGEIPFKVSFYIDDVNEKEYIYQIVIDEATTSLENVQALVIHNQKTKNIFPSIGIVDEPITLNEKNKGINLVGYVEKKENIVFRVWIAAGGKEYLVTYNSR